MHSRQQIKNTHGVNAMSVVNNLIVLVVEDDDFQRMTLVQMLRVLGVQEVLEASDGQQALALLSSLSPLISVVICDLEMPNMDGMELLRHAGQAQNPASVIISSSKDQSLLDSVGVMARAYGINLLGVIKKPATLKNLSSLLDRHVPLKRPDVDFLKFTLGEVLQGVNDKQFEPFFQPKLDCKTEKLLGAEVLARWYHPEHGLIYPHAFIPQLEKDDHIIGLTMLLLEKAAAACRTWRERGLDLTVSVNISLASLNDTSIADQITDVVRLAGLDPRHMILEITETMIMQEIGPALENLARLRMRGFGLSVDDYGTGYSGLQQLMRVPFTELKIDQGFVIDCATNAASRTVVESSIAMARRLGLKTVAEGVERQAEWDILKAAGCDMVQGYFIAKPMDNLMFLNFWAANNANGNANGK